MVVEYGLGPTPVEHDVSPDLAIPDDSMGWITRLTRGLDARAPEMERYEDYYEGRHPLLFATSLYRRTFGQLFRGFADNFCGVVVDAVEERLNVEGFRVGQPRPAGRVSTTQLVAAGDQDAWRIWQANQLDAWSGTAHVEALVKGEAYALVSPFRADWPDDGTPLISIEDPLEVIVEGSTANRRKRLAALKRWRDDEGLMRCTLYLPDRIEKFIQKRDRRPVTNASQMTAMEGPAPVIWVPRQDPGDASWPLPNPLRVVPVVPLVNQPRLTGPGRSEIAPVLPIQDALNKLFADMLVASEYAAFRQRWATGIEIPTDPTTGEPIETFAAAVHRIVSTAAPDAKFGSFEESDLANYVKAIETAVQHVATITRTPAHYLLGQSGTFPSGESLKSTETGLVAKARRRMRHFGESWEEVIRVAFAALGDPRSRVLDSEVIWRDPESRTEAEHVDALIKLASIDVPREQLWEDAGYTPQQINRFREMRAADPTPDPPVNPLGTKAQEVAN